MKSLVVAGLAAGAVTVLICTSKAGDVLKTLALKPLPKRVKPHVDYLLNCTFCTSWWVSLAMLGRFNFIEWAATVAIANITVLLIHWSLSTVEEPTECSDGS